MANRCISLYALVNAEAILGNRASYAHALSLWKEPWVTSRGTQVP